MAKPARSDGLSKAALWLAVAFTSVWLLIAAFGAEGERHAIEATQGTYEFGLYEVLTIVNLPIGIALYITTCLWLYRCRSNVVLLRPEANQTRRAGWVWFGWMTPFVAAWFPYQVVRDIGTTPKFQGHPAQRPPALGLWWTLWLLTNIVSNISLPFVLSDDPDMLNYSAEFDIASGLTTAVAAFFWIRIVQYIRRDQDALLAGAGIPA